MLALASSTTSRLVCRRSARERMCTTSSRSSDARVLLVVTDPGIGRMHCIHCMMSMSMSTMMAHVRVCQSECRYVMQCMRTSMMIVKRPVLIRCIRCIISEGEGEGASSWLRHNFGDWGRSSWRKRSSRLEGELNGSTNASKAYFYLPSVCWVIQGSHLWKTMKILGRDWSLEKSQSRASLSLGQGPSSALGVQQRRQTNKQKSEREREREREMSTTGSWGTSSRR